jgi:hypothetical protein
MQPLHMALIALRMLGRVDAGFTVAPLPQPPWQPLPQPPWQPAG